jgi:hypothetical protein
MADDKELTWHSSYALGWGLLGSGKLACYPFAATEHFDEQPMRAGNNKSFDKEEKM